MTYVYIFNLDTCLSYVTGNNSEIHCMEIIFVLNTDSIRYRNDSTRNRNLNYERLNSVSSIYIWSKNSRLRVKPKMAEIHVQFQSLSIILSARLARATTQPPAAVTLTSQWQNREHIQSIIVYTS